MSSLVKEFKEFALRGSVVDMAVGIIIGAAFGKVVSSLVGDILMPVIGLLLGGVDFTTLSLTLKSATADSDAVLLMYGNFIQTVVDFLIIAAAIFLMIKALNSLQRQEEEAAPPAPPEPSAEEKLLAEIRDLLKERP